MIRGTVSTQLLQVPKVGSDDICWRGEFLDACTYVIVRQVNTRLFCLDSDALSSRGSQNVHALTVTRQIWQTRRKGKEAVIGYFMPQVSKELGRMAIR